MRSVIAFCWLAGWWLAVAEARHVLDKRQALDDVTDKSPLHEVQKGDLGKPDSKVDANDTLDEHKDIAIEGLDHTRDKDLSGKEELVADKDVIEDIHKPEEKGDKLVDGDKPKQGDDLVVESGESSEESSEVLALVAVFLVEPPAGGGRRGWVRELPLKQLL